MIRKTTLFFALILTFSAYSQENENIIKATKLFENERYGLAQDLFYQIYESESSLDYQKEIALLKIAFCSSYLFNNDTKYWLERFINEYPYSDKINLVNYKLGLLHYGQQLYSEGIKYFLRSGLDYDDLNFKLAYSYFMIDSLESSKYYFSKLLYKQSKYTSTSQYFYAHIAYKRKYYKTALTNFQQLDSDKNFSSIIPYYISQIYFLQNRFDDLISYAVPMLDSVIASREAELYRMIADSYYKKKDYSNSVKYFNEYFVKTTKTNDLDKLQIGHAYHNIKDYENAIKYLEPLNFSVDSLIQFTSYYLASSYLNIEEKNYALISFKKASEYDYNKNLKDDAYFNYAKLSYELDLPFDNVLDILEAYLIDAIDTENKEVINSLMINAFQNTNRYEQALTQLKELEFPTIEQKKAIQKLSFFIGVKEYNDADYSGAISFFELSNRFKIDDKILVMSTYWLAECNYKIQNFSESVKLYNEYISTTSSVINFAFYNLGYSYFQQKEYSKARDSFRQFIKLTKDSIRLNDSYLRVADCYFMLSEFKLAEVYYDAASKYGLFDKDYALYNRSICLGLTGKVSRKLSVLKNLEDKYINSAYYDDALHDLAVYYKNKNQTDISISYYKKLLDYTQETHVKAKVYLSMGMIYFNSNQIDEAINSFLIVINDYANTNYFKEALAGLRSAYISIAKVDEYLDIVNSIPQLSLSKLEQDSLFYNTAFMKFAEGDYNIAKKAFLDYLNYFSKGVFCLDAHYFLAKSFVQLDDTTNSLLHFMKVIEYNSKYLETSYLYLARHFFSIGSYEESNTYYLTLEKIATTNSIKREAVIRLLLGYSINEDKYIDKAIMYSKKALSLDKLDKSIEYKAKIILARYDFNNGNFYKAEQTYRELCMNSNDMIGAEAAYMIAYIMYLNDSLEASESRIYQLANDFNADYWIAKAFILLSDIYKQRDNIFQARATLESIIENYEGIELLLVAREKYESILVSEISDTNTFRIPEAYINIYDKDIDYEVLFEREDTVDIIKTIDNEN